KVTFSVFYLRGGLIRAVLSLNDTKTNEVGGKLIEAGKRIDEKTLADPAVDLSELMPTPATCAALLLEQPREGFRHWAEQRLLLLFGQQPVREKAQCRRQRRVLGFVAHLAMFCPPGDERGAGFG